MSSTCTVCSAMRRCSQHSPRSCAAVEAESRELPIKPFAASPKEILSLAGVGKPGTLGTKIWRPYCSSVKFLMMSRKVAWVAPLELQFKKRAFP